MEMGALSDAKLFYSILSIRLHEQLKERDLLANLSTPLGIADEARRWIRGENLNLRNHVYASLNGIID
jgi:hypothetical protein